MGYTTEYIGTIKVEPSMSAELRETLYRFSEERHGGNLDHPDYPGFWCDWVATPLGTGIEWNGNEKFYDGPEWMQLVIDRFLKPAGHVCNGALLAQGEDPSDVWQLVVTDNVVSIKRGRIVFEEA